MADKIRRVTMRLARLGEIVEAARLATTNPANGKPYQVAPICRDSGINRGTWTAIEEGEHRSWDSIYAQLESFFDWEAGSIKRYLDENGPEPGPVSEPEPPADEEDEDEEFIAELVDEARALPEWRHREVLAMLRLMNDESGGRRPRKPGPRK